MFVNVSARTGEGLWQASEVYAPLQAWQRMGEPTIAAEVADLVGFLASDQAAYISAQIIGISGAML